MINPNSPTVRYDQPPPPAEHEEPPVANRDNGSPPSLSQSPDDDDFSQETTHSDSDEERQTRHGIKRQWREVAADANGQEPLPSAAPALKRPRTAAPGPACETFSRHHDADLIALVRKHGGQIVHSQGDFLWLTLPPAENLEFQVAITCLKLLRLRDGKQFLGRETFVPAAFGAFAACLEAASLANQPEWVRSLLATGMGKSAGELLRQIVARAALAGAHEVIDVLTDECAYWAQGAGAFTVGWLTEASIRAGNSDVAPEHWQSMVRDGLSGTEFHQIIDSFRRGDADTALCVLFSPEHRPSAGRFFLRTITSPSEDGSDLLKNWLVECGAIHIKESDKNGLVIYTTHFDRAALQDKLLQWQAEQSESPDSSDDAALVIAAQWGDPDIFNALLARETNVAQKPYAAETMRAAAAAGATEIVRCLLDFGIAADNANGSDETALILAAAQGRTAVCALLLEHGALLQPNGWTSGALLSAAKKGHTATCAFLIGQGANIEPTPYSSALLVAADKGWRKTCQLLVTAGARLDKTDRSGYSVLSHVAYFGDIQLYKYLLARGAAQQAPASQVPPLNAAAAANRTAMLAYLLEHGGTVNSTSPNGPTALIDACASGAFEAVEFLLDKGANPDPLQSSEENALISAIESSSLPVFLRIFPLFVPSKSVYWIRALNSAIRENQPEMVRILCDVGFTNPLIAELPARENPLLAISYSNSDFANARSEARHQILMKLLSKNTPLHHVDKDGNDALILATKASDVIAIDLLLNTGMRIGQANKKGKNALHYAFTNIDAIDRRISSHIIERLYRTLAHQENSSVLLSDLLLKQQNPVMRDLSMHFSRVNATGVMDISRLMAQEERVMDECRLKLLTQTKPELDEQTESQVRLYMAAIGITSALIDLLVPLLRELLQMRTALFGQRVAGSERVFQAALDGFYVMLGKERDTLAEKFVAHYRDAPIDTQWQTTLATHSSQWLMHRTEVATSREDRLITPIFENLFSLCASKALAGKDYPAALKLPAIPVGEIASALVFEGVYSTLAINIEAAWMRAWQNVADRQAPVAIGNARMHNSSTTVADDAPGPGLDWELELNENPMGFDMNIDFSSLANAPVSPAATDSSLADALLSEFRDALDMRVDRLSATEDSVLSLAGVSPATAKTYANLMFRQLHMLAQFIHPERFIHAAHSTT